MHTWNHWSLTLSELLKGLLHVQPVAMEHLVNAEPDALGSLNIYTTFKAFYCKSPSNGLILKEHVTNCLSLLLLGGRRVLPSSRGNSAKEELCGSKLWNLQNFQWSKRNKHLFSLIGFCSLSSAHCISLNKNMVYHSCTDLIWNYHPCPPPPLPLPPRTLSLFFLCPSDCAHPFLISTFGPAMSTRDRLILVPPSATSVNSCERWHPRCNCVYLPLPLASIMPHKCITVINVLAQVRLSVANEICKLCLNGWKLLLFLAKKQWIS